MSILAVPKKEESGDGETRIGISDARECNIHSEGAQQGGGGEVRRGASAVAENGRIIYCGITHLADT